MTDRQLEERAADLWAGTDLADSYPRNIEHAIAFKLPVTVVKLPVVTVRAAGRWLRQHRRCPVFPAYRRDLMGCLYADGGQGFIFVCGADEPDEQRFTLAHDTAHFLVDYWWPRLHVIQTLGTSIVDVLDGNRPAEHEERVAGLLAHVHLGPHWHLLPRFGVDAEADPRIACAESRADELGLELVAPRERVKSLVREAGKRRSGNQEKLCAFLGAFFGLPPYLFKSDVAASRIQRPPSFLEDVRQALGG